MSVTLGGRNNTGERQMLYLSNVANRRPMLRVAGEIVLAFSCATPLVLLLGYVMLGYVMLGYVMLCYLI